MTGHVGMDATLHDLERKRTRAPRGPVMPSLFDAAETVQDGLNCSGASEQKAEKSRVEAVMDAHTTTSRHWIDLGKPIAAAVANAAGTVTAETFRAEADKRGKLPTLTEQRTLCWIPVMFAELCKEGHLQKRRRGDGSVVREYSKLQANHQVVYEPVPRT